MRKTIMDQEPGAAPADREQWLDLESLASVEVSSEDPAHPIEAALVPGLGGGWRAGGAGEQVIRLSFDHPLSLGRVQLVFDEQERARSQEFLLGWQPEGAREVREIIRQQYNFSPPGTTREVEDHRMELQGVVALELRIVPDTGGGQARAKLTSLRLA